MTVRGITTSQAPTLVGRLEQLVAAWNRNTDIKNARCAKPLRGESNRVARPAVTNMTSVVTLSTRATRQYQTGSDSCAAMNGIAVHNAKVAMLAAP